MSSHTRAPYCSSGTAAPPLHYRWESFNLASNIHEHHDGESNSAANRPIMLNGDACPDKQRSDLTCEPEREIAALDRPSIIMAVYAGSSAPNSALQSDGFAALHFQRLGLLSRIQLIQRPARQFRLTRKGHGLMVRYPILHR